MVLYLYLPVSITFLLLTISFQDSKYFGDRCLWGDEHGLMYHGKKPKVTL